MGRRGRIGRRTRVTGRMSREQCKTLDDLLVLGCSGTYYG